MKTLFALLLMAVAISPALAQTAAKPGANAKAGNHAEIKGTASFRIDRDSSARLGHTRSGAATSPSSGSPTDRHPR